MLLKNCKYIITQNSSRDILENYDLLIEDNRIKTIAKSLSTKRIVTNKASIIDCSNKIILPGLINCHTHVGMQSLRGICDDEELPVWLNRIIAAEKELSNKQLKENAMIACKEMLNNGITCFLDMYYPMQPIAESISKTGMRAVLFPAIYEAAGDEQQQWIEMEQLRILYQKSTLIDIGIGPHSSYMCSEAMLKKVKAYAKNNNMLISMHIAETRKERYDIFKKTEKLPVQYLEEIGFLGNKTILVHAVWLTKGEVVMLGKTKTKVVHCPVSNMKLSSGGVTPLIEMFENSVVVALGTDSVASNNSLNMLEEMKVTGLLHKHHRWDAKAATVQQIIDMATINAAEIINKEKELGSLEEGKLADIITLGIKENLWPISKKNLLSQLIYSCQTKNVEDVFINGVKLK